MCDLQGHSLKVTHDEESTVLPERTRDLTTDKRFLNELKYKEESEMLLLLSKGKDLYPGQESES